MARELKKVLIVDDEETLTWSMAKSLSRDRDKYEIEIANNGKEALDVLGKMPIDLVLSDIRMPDINGLDLLVQIKRDYPETKVIIMTAYGSSDVQREASKRGSLYYIEKPFEINEIRKLILDLIKEGTISGKIAKDVFDIVWTEGGNPAEIVEARGLKQVTDTGAIEKAVDEVIAANPDKVEQAKQKPALIGWFVGQVMKATAGKASPQSVNALLKSKLGIE